MNNQLVSKTTLIVGTMIAFPSLYGAENVYQVKSGDTLSKIAMDFSSQYVELNWRSGLELIKELNADKFENYDRIEVGQNVRLPDEDYVHTYLAGVSSTKHQVVKRKPFNPQSNLVNNMTSDDQKGRDVAQDTVTVDTLKKKPDQYTIDDAKKLEIKEATGMTSSPRSLKEVQKTAVKPVAKPVSKPIVKPIEVKEEVKVTEKSSNTPSTYLIKEGDTLSEIALKFFGSEKLYDANEGPMKDILALNPNVKNPDLIFAGSQLVLPTRNVASEKTTQKMPKVEVEKHQDDELYWSQKERMDSLNPDFSFLDYQQSQDFDFVNNVEGMTFKVV